MDINLKSSTQVLAMALANTLRCDILDLDVSQVSNGPSEYAWNITLPSYLGNTDILTIDSERIIGSNVVSDVSVLESGSEILPRHVRC